MYVRTVIIIIVRNIYGIFSVASDFPVQGYENSVYTYTCISLNEERAYSLFASCLMLCVGEFNSSI